MTIIRMDSASWCFAFFFDISYSCFFLQLLIAVVRFVPWTELFLKHCSKMQVAKKNPKLDHLMIYNRMMLSLFWILGFPKCSNFESCGNHHFLQKITLGIYSKNWILIKLIKFNMIIIFLFYDMYSLIFRRFFQNRTEQNRAEQNKTEQNRTE